MHLPVKNCFFKRVHNSLVPIQEHPTIKDTDTHTIIQDGHNCGNGHARRGQGLGLGFSALGGHQRDSRPHGQFRVFMKEKGLAEQKGAGNGCSLLEGQFHQGVRRAVFCLRHGLRPDPANNLSPFGHDPCKVESGVTGHPLESHQEVGYFPVLHRGDEPKTEGGDMKGGLYRLCPAQIDFTGGVEVQMHPVGGFAEHGSLEQFTAHNKRYGADQEGYPQKTGDELGTNGVKHVP